MPSLFSFRLRRFLARAGALAACALFASPLAAAELRIRLVGSSGSGALHVYVFTAADGFPKEEKAVAHGVYPAPAGKEVEVAIQAPDAAEYALMAYQDKNGDGKMNRLLGMIPQEPYGLSRNPQVFGKPKFADAALRDGELEAIVIMLHD